MPVGGPTDPTYQAGLQQADVNHAACLANLPPAPPQNPPDALALSNNPCSGRDPIMPADKRSYSPVRRKDIASSTCIEILDPVPDLQEGNQITTDVQTLATSATPRDRATWWIRGCAAAFGRRSAGLGVWFKQRHSRHREQNLGHCAMRRRCSSDGRSGRLLHRVPEPAEYVVGKPSIESVGLAVP